jgi:general L-amino acid transport system substrate-binding protein
MHVRHAKLYEWEASGRRYERCKGIRMCSKRKVTLMLSQLWIFSIGMRWWESSAVRSSAIGIGCSYDVLDHRLLLCLCHIGALALAIVASSSITCLAQTLARVQQRGALVCGVNEDLPGFSSEHDQKWSGFDVDLSRAVAAAIFADADRVQYMPQPLNAGQRFEALRSGGIDILSRNSTWTMSREVDLNLVFPAITYFDGQGFLIQKAFPVTSPLEFDNTKVCVQSGTTTEPNLIDYFKSNHMRLELMSFETRTAALRAYDEGLCDVFTSDVSELHADRLELSAPENHVILPDIISKEPLGPVVRKGDEQWADIVKWTVFALINAEELGITSKNIDQGICDGRPEIIRLMGKDRNYAEGLKLPANWAVRIIRLVGNYREIYEHNVGLQSKLGIPRGLNRLWSDGGILYAPPIR